MPRRALITGITGQDGSYLDDQQLAKGYEVHGIVRRTAIEHQEHRLWRLKHILDQISPCTPARWRALPASSG